MSKESARKPRSDSSRKIEISSEGSEIYGAMVYISTSELSQTGTGPERTEYIVVRIHDDGVDISAPKNTKTNRYGILPLNE
jgi:hypothetical protein